MRLFALIGFFAVIGVVAGAVYVFGGYFNVAALPEDNKIVAWALVHVREASIRHRAPETAPVNVEDAAVIQAGAKAFAARGCVNCHGAPGAEWAKFSEGLRPDAADLNEIAKIRTPGEIFWVVKNGINMTGMPSFARLNVEDQEIWAIAAFVKKLPAVSKEDYKAWTQTSQ